MTASAPQEPRPRGNPSSGPARGHLAGDSILLAAGRMAGLASTLFLFVLLSRTLTPSEYGSFRQVWLINKSLVEVFALGLPLSVLYYLARLDDGEKKRFIAQSVVLLAVGAATTSLAVFLAADLIARAFDNPELAPLLRLFCVYPVLIAPSLALEGVLIVGRRVRKFVYFSVASRAAVFLAGTIAVVLGGDLFLLFTLILAAGAGELIAAVLLHRSAAIDFQAAGRPGQLARRPSVREQFGVALPTGLSNMVGIINQELDKLMIAGSFSVAQFARYANGAMEIPALGTIISSVSTVLMPEFTRRFHAGDREGLLRLWHDSICHVALLHFPILVFFWAYADEFIVLLFSDTYRESALIFQIYILATVPKLTWYGTFLVAVGRPKAPLYGAVVALAINVVLNVLLIEWIGFTGPAIATAAASYGVTLFYLSRMVSVLDVNWWAVFPWARLVRILIVALLAAVAFVPIEGFTGLPDPARLAIAGGTYGAMILAMYGGLGLVSVRDLRDAVGSLFAPDGVDAESGGGGP